MSGCWLEVKTDGNWVAAGNHAGCPTDNDQPLALVLYQSANMGGEYVRVISWCLGRDQTRFTTYRPGSPYPQDRFYFDLPMSAMTLGMILHNTQKEGEKYQVVQDRDTYVKVCERIK